MNAFAAPLPPSPPLAGVLHGKGRLVILKAFTVPGTFEDGTQFYNRSVSYRGAGPDGLICSADFSTSKGVGPVSTPGQDAVFKVGDSAPWIVDDEIYGARFSTRKLENGNTLQQIQLRFSSLGPSPIMDLTCNAVTDAMLTVSDFEAATGGLMSLQAY